MLSGGFCVRRPASLNLFAGSRMHDSVDADASGIFSCQPFSAMAHRAVDDHRPAHYHHAASNQDCIRRDQAQAASRNVSDLHVNGRERPNAETCRRFLRRHANLFPPIGSSSPVHDGPNSGRVLWLSVTKVAIGQKSCSLPTHHCTRMCRACRDVLMLITDAYSHKYAKPMPLGKIKHQTYRNCFL